jgi:hypothetical protein
VHLTSEKNARLILRNGINRMRRQVILAGGIRPGGIFAMPVTRNFYISHQWLRELKRGPRATVVAVYFRIPDEDPVWVGHYNQAHQKMTAAEATAAVMASENREGYQVIVPRRIDKTEIRRVKHLPQLTGWRYYPGAHGKRPCGCKFCQRGQYGARRLRQEFESLPS